MEQIAAEAGLSKGAIYWYFKSKLELFIAIVDQYVEHNVATLKTLVLTSKDGPQSFYTVHQQVYAHHAEHSACNSLFGQFIALTDRHPEIKDRLLHYHRIWDDAGATLINHAIQHKDFKAVDALRLSQAIGAIYNGLAMRERFDPEIDSIGVLETATKLIYEALAVKSTH